MYALIMVGDSGLTTEREYGYIPADPAVIFALTKTFDDGGQCCRNDGLSEDIRHG